MEVLTTKRFEFSAAHRCWNADWNEGQNQAVFGKATTPFGHGHNYVLEVTVAGPVDDRTGMVINIVELKRIVEVVLDRFDHKHLNEDTPYFRDRQPTTENLVQVLWSLIVPALPHTIRLHRLRLYATSAIFADFYGGGTANFSRSYSFSAAHRLHSAQLSPGENQQLYGKCNNESGHGHDYRFEVTISGTVDRVTGRVMNIVDLDRAVQPLLDELDHTHLDREQAAFRDRPSTAENVVLYLWECLEQVLGTRLHWIRLWETANNMFEYGVSEP
ncbi:MAG: 6-carboxytetrahydropterin synthase [Herpetosiphonaceae bacterium]|nr:6-carboxytetrahydropterin synthase [Herpetosiphonaceae bacterium]